MISVFYRVSVMTVQYLPWEKLRKDREELLSGLVILVKIRLMPRAIW